MTDEQTVEVSAITGRQLIRAEEVDGTIHERASLRDYRFTRDGVGNLVQVYTWIDEDTEYTWTRNVPV